MDSLCLLLSPLLLSLIGDAFVVDPAAPAAGSQEPAVIVQDPARSPTPDADPLEPAFRDPPQAARPMVRWPWLNGFVDRERMTYELRQMRAKGLRGPIIWDIGSLADPESSIPVGPAGSFHTTNGFGFELY